MNSRATTSPMKPLQDRILLRPDKPEEFTRGGLVIPEAYREKSGKATVLAVGEGMWCKDGTRYPMLGLKPGDRVLFEARHPFPTTELDGEAVIIARDDMILAEIVEE